MTSVQTTLVSDARWPARAQKGRWKRLGWLVLAGCLVQAIGGWFTVQSVTDWYPTLQKTAWSPPNWVFGPMWTLLYVLMVLAGWRIWQKLIAFGEAHPWSHPAMRAYGWQMLFNFLWSPIFFGMRQPTLALIDLGITLILVGWMLLEFRKLDRTAYYSQWPYALWLIFAFSLNCGIVILN